MTQTSLETNAASPYALIVKMNWGDASEVRYCRWTSDLTINGQVYTSLPAVAVRDFPEMHGGIEDAPFRLIAPTSASPFGSMVTGRAFAAVHVSIGEVAADDPTSYREIFYGLVSKAKRNPNGRTGLVEIEVMGIKSRFKLVTGISATTTCPWQFGDHICQINVAAKTKTGTVDSFGGAAKPHRIFVTFDGAPSLANSWWKKGYFEIDGLRIQIRRSLEDGRFDLVRIPPLNWVGAAFKARPGCDKRVETCRDIWDNEQRFGGIGIAIPAYNPIFEEGG